MNILIKNAELPKAWPIAAIIHPNGDVSIITANGERFKTTAANMPTEEKGE